LSSRLDVFIEALNVNDNVPMTSQPVYFPKVAENSKPFTTVITLDAYDGDDDVTTSADDVVSSDAKPGKTFEIVSGNPQSLFFIDPNTGAIRYVDQIRSLNEP
jgi:protocadherin Fat 1/2/3